MRWLAGFTGNGDMDSIDCLVIGAGVIGLAVARELAQSGREVLIVEHAARIGTGISARNSEVIHAGIHYPAGSLKARLCVAGRQLLYDYCIARGVAHRRCGKLIVATTAAQAAQLEAIRARAAANGVADIEPLTRAQALRLEPALHCVAALHSPSTGIVDSQALILALLGDAEAAGAILALNSRVIRGEVEESGLRLEIADAGGIATTLRASTVINAAGLSASAVARSFAGLDSRHVPEPHFAKGNYFALSGRVPFSRLVYPVPVPGGLGVHLTLDLGGQARFGPDVEWLAETEVGKIDYAVDAKRAAGFEAEVRRYWPALPEGALQPAYSGVRPKIAPPGTEADFVIQGPRTHGVAGLVNLFGIESPGLTSCLAIAREAAAAI